MVDLCGPIARPLANRSAAQRQARLGRSCPARVLALFDRLATVYPHWNRTLASGGPVRHLLISPCDHGPADCMYDRVHRPVDYLDDRPGGIVRWRHVDYRSSARRVAMLTLNGYRHEGV